MGHVSLTSLLLVSLIAISCGQEKPTVVRSQPNTTATTPAADQSTTTPGTTSSGSTTPSTSTGASTPVDTTIPAGPTTSAVSVAAGSVTFDLASAKAALPGATLAATLTVNAAAGAAAASISLSNIAIKAPASTGFVLYRPVLVLSEAGKETQFPIGTNINLKIPKGRSVPLAGMTAVTFENIAAGASIKLRFSALEPLADALLDGIPNYRECKAPQNFTAVANALQSCKSCHSGLFSYDFMDKDMATACGQNLKIIDRSLSGTGTVPNIPTGAHQGVNAGAVSTAIAPWKTAEGL